MTDRELVYNPQFPIADIKPWAENPRRIPPDEMEKLKTSIKTFGFLQPVLLRKGDHRVVGGHQRLEAAIQLDMTHVPANIVPLTEQEYKVLNVALNKIGGDWDYPKLMGLLDDVVGQGLIPIEMTGFSQEYLDSLHEDLDTGDPGDLGDSGIGFDDDTGMDGPVDLCPTCGKVRNR